MKMFVTVNIAIMWDSIGRWGTPSVDVICGPSSGLPYVQKPSIEFSWIRDIRCA